MSKQKLYLKPGEAISSPMVSLEALLGTLIVDVHEEREVAIFDVPGAYLCASIPKDKNVLIKFHCQFTEIMCGVNPEYKKNVIAEKGQNILYVKVLQAINGCIKSALLWYDLYSQTSVKMSFELNPYDNCVAKIRNGK